MEQEWTAASCRLYRRLFDALALLELLHGRRAEKILIYEGALDLREQLEFLFNAMLQSPEYQLA